MCLIWFQISDYCRADNTQLPPTTHAHGADPDTHYQHPLTFWTSPAPALQLSARQFVSLSQFLCPVSQRRAAQLGRGGGGVPAAARPRHPRPRPGPRPGQAEPGPAGRQAQAGGRGGQGVEQRGGGVPDLPQQRGGHRDHRGGGCGRGGCQEEGGGG